MKEEEGYWDDDWDEEEAALRECAWQRSRFWLEMKARGCHYTIITPYYTIVDGRMEIKRPSARHIVTAAELLEHDDRPSYIKKKKEERLFENCLKGILPKPRQPDYLESWKKKHRKSLVLNHK